MLRNTLVFALATSLLPATALAADWDVSFGDIPSNTHIDASLGFTNLPKVALMIPLSSTFEIGPAFTFDLGYYQTNFINPGIFFSAPMRVGVFNENKLSVGLNFEPGIAMQFRGAFGFGFLFNAGINIGYQINDMFVFGGGAALPMALRVTNGVSFTVPVLFGPVLEIHVKPQLAFVFDMKFGPHISAAEGGGSGVVFGVKLNLGVAYKF